MKTVYNSVFDVDPIVGMYLEIKEGLLGPTTKCIWAEQFYRFKFGDRFFYSFQKGPYPFTPGIQILCLCSVLFVR